MNKEFFYKNYQWIIIILCIIGVALCSYSLGTHDTDKKDSYINNAVYQQQKEACLTGKVKCNPIAQTAN